MIDTSVMGMTGWAENVQWGHLEGAAWLGRPRVSPRLRHQLTYLLSPATHKIDCLQLFRVLLSSPREPWHVQRGVAGFATVCSSIAVASER